jgi:predicted negative regulator of RcsB-dependent stress response
MSAGKSIVGLTVLGIGLYLLYKVYQSGYENGTRITTQRYEQKLQVKDNKIQELLTVVDQLQKELEKLKKSSPSK